VSQSISDDRLAATFIFDSYVAYTGPGVAIPESRKAFQMNINLNIPQGWSYSIVDITYRGYMQLAAGQTAVQSAVYYFSGNSGQARVSTPNRGPVAKDYTISDRLGLNTLVVHASNVVVPLNIKSEVAITGNTNARGQITTDSIDIKITPVFYIPLPPLPDAAVQGDAATADAPTTDSAALGANASSASTTDDGTIRTDASLMFVDTIPEDVPANVARDLIADSKDYLNDQLKARALEASILADAAMLASINDILAAEGASLEQLKLDPETNAAAIKDLEHQIDKDQNTARIDAMWLEQDQDHLVKVQSDLALDLQHITDDLGALHA
jgi:hypothetical protein